MCWGGERGLRRFERASLVLAAREHVPCSGIGRSSLSLRAGSSRAMRFPLGGSSSSPPSNQHSQMDAHFFAPTKASISAVIFSRPVLALRLVETPLARPNSRPNATIGLDALNRMSFNEAWPQLGKGKRRRLACLGAGTVGLATRGLWRTWTRQGGPFTACKRPPAALNMGGYYIGARHGIAEIRWAIRQPVHFL